MTIDIVKDYTLEKSNLFVPKSSDSPAASSILLPMATGMYRLDCYVRFYEFDDFGVWYVKSIEPIGKKDNVGAEHYPIRF